MKTFMCLILGVGLICSSTGRAGEFFNDFESLDVEGAKLFGTAIRLRHGGLDDSGVLHLTRANPYEIGSLVIDPLDGGTPVQSFTLSTFLRLGGGTGGDGIGLNFAPNIPEEAFKEQVGNGMQLVLDTFKNHSEVAPGVRIYFKGKAVAEKPIPNLRTNGFAHFMVKVDPDGTLDLSYNYEMVLSNVRSSITNVTGRFGWGGRTGRLTDHQCLDDLHILTRTTAGPFVDVYSPLGFNASPSPMIELVLQDYGTKVDKEMIELFLDDKQVTPAITTEKSGRTRITFLCEELLKSGSEHEVKVLYVDDGARPQATTFKYKFFVTEDVILNP